MSPRMTVTAAQPPRPSRSPSPVANDAPVIEGGVVDAAVTELNDGDPAENAFLHQANGNIDFSDVDLTDSHTVSATPTGLGYLGALITTINPDSTGTGTGNVDWTFDVQDAALDTLAEGEIRVQIYDVDLDDGNGGMTTQQVTITLNGKADNDGPIVVPGNSDVDGAVTERADLDPNENVAPPLTDTGNIEFTDVNLADTHIISVDPTAPGYFGTLTAVLNPDSTGTGTGNVDWTFEVDDADIDFLADGEALVQTYNVTIDDGSLGGTAVQAVEITITGTNDAPVIAGGIFNGGVTELPDLDGDENLITHSTSGLIDFVDVDLADSHTVTATPTGIDYLGTLTPVIVDPATGDGTGIVEWTFEVPDADIDFLAQGETRVQFYDVTIDDGEGGSAVQSVEITITGSNDAPVIAGGKTAADFIEIIDGGPGENINQLDDTGIINFSDADLTDAHTVSTTPTGPGAGSYRGALTAALLVDSTGGITGEVEWTFAIFDVEMDNLAEDETLVQTYDVELDDGNGGMTAQQVTITITGTNDAPVIEGGVFNGGVTEIADGAPGENVDTLSSSGFINFSDVDLADSHTVSATPTGMGYLGTLTAVLNPDSTGTGTGNVDWTFEVPDAALDELAAGETLVQTYEVTVDDGTLNGNLGSSATQLVEITLTGSNDEPVIAGVVVDGAVTELTDGDPDENAFLHQANGLIDFVDVDLADSHTVSATPAGPGYLGTLTPVIVDPATGDGTGSIDWTFEVDDADIDFLADGETRTQLYDVTIDDGEGGTAVQPVEITLTGTNDAPEIFGVDNGGVTEIADGAPGENAITHMTDGVVNFIDVDIADTHTVTHVDNGPGYLGTFTTVVDADDPTTDLVLNTWQFAVDDADIDFLAAGETRVQTYDVTADDGNGGTATQTVEVTITGSNDAPEIAGGVVDGAVTELNDGDPDENAFLHQANGNIDFSDVDLTDSHTVSATPTGPGFLGTLTAMLNPDSTGAGIGNVDWTFDVQDSALDTLAEGEIRVQIYDVDLDDGNGGMTTQQVTITLNGKADNDGPIVVPGNSDVDGAVTERADLDPNENVAPPLTDTGNIEFTDVNLADTHIISVDPTAPGYFGTLTAVLNPDSTGTGTGNVDWTFEVDDADIDFLADGEALVQTYNVTIDDGSLGGTAVQAVEITITGTNDAPVIAGGIFNGGVTELPDLDGDENLITHSTSGLIDFVDVDLADSHTVTATPTGIDYLGTLTPVIVDPATGDGTGIVEWTFEVPDADIDFLAQGETRVQFYDVTIDDGEGGSAVQSVEITITGSNDAPVIAGGKTAADFIEIIDGGPGENINQLDDTGIINFSDADLTDAHTVSTTPTGPGAGSYRGALTAALLVDSTGGITGEVEWTFAIFDVEMDNLAEDETLVQTYDVELDDGNGGMTAQQVTITITGTNDAPVIEGGVFNGGVTEIADGAPGENVDTLSSSGFINFSDVDLADSHTVSATPTGMGYLGTLTAVLNPDSTGTGTGNVDWTFEVPDAALDELAAGETLVQTYEVTVDDGTLNGNLGSSATQLVEITLTGSNDEPVIAGVVVDGAVTELTDGDPDENAFLHQANGLIDFVDVDLADSHTVSATPAGPGYLGTLTPVIVDPATGDGTGSVDWIFEVDDADYRFPCRRARPVCRPIRCHHR